MKSDIGVLALPDAQGEGVQAEDDEIKYPVQAPLLVLNNARVPEGQCDGQILCHRRKFALILDFWVILAGIKLRWLGAASKQSVNVQTFEQCNSRAREYRRNRGCVAIITSARSSHIDTASHEDASTSNFFEAQPGCAEVPLLRRGLRRRHKFPQHAQKLRQAA
ncbi:hypothetical protein EDB89DRAFT_1909935 [Lactarius sanguifluus]|nr:hypothetical protein EDB89DRAFT_1909935 [Lactarius sanguifluus]